MTIAPPCGDPYCPVPQATDRVMAAVADHRLPSGTSLARGHPAGLSPAGFGVPGAGRDGRFSPIPGAAHAYVARSPTAALLETALRDVDDPDRTVHVPALRAWSWGRVTTTSDLRLADLRDDALAALELRPEQLSTASPRHYGCTGRWGKALHRAGFDGILWHSRQAALHRAALDARDGLAALLLHHSAIEVAVIWNPPSDPGVLAVDAAQQSGVLLTNGRPSRLVIELAALLAIVLE